MLLIFSNSLTINYMQFYKGSQIEFDHIDQGSPRVTGTGKCKESQRPKSDLTMRPLGSKKKIKNKKSHCHCQVPDSIRV